MSVSENIRIGRPEADCGEIIEAARKAGCENFIKELCILYGHIQNFQYTLYGYHCHLRPDDQLP